MILEKVYQKVKAGTAIARKGVATKSSNMKPAISSKTESLLSNHL